MKNNASYAPFLIYNASAGAGKTFALVKEYLKISLGSQRPDRFKQILAITFTNKAATEMKARLLGGLETIAKAKSAEDHPMIPMLLEELELSFNTLQQRAQASLHSILHNYSLLAVSTIDTFTNKLIRSFSRELHLSANYEVELDLKGLLQEAVQLMLDNLREGQDDTAILKGFLRQRMGDEKSPKIERDIVELMQKVYYDEHSVPYLQALQGLTTPDFIAIAQKIYKEKGQVEKQRIAIAQAARFQLEQYHIDEDLFAHNGNFLKHLWEIEIGKYSYLKRTKTNTQILQGEKDFYSKKDASRAAPVFDPIADELRQLLLTADEKLQHLQRRTELLDKVRENFYAMAVIREVESYLEDIKESTNRLPIGEFNRLISEHIREQPAPFLYEKLGERYQHFFIDEFQDTSRLQWQNMVPLINNALAGGHATGLIVGDAKQAIYRFRGGEAEQFISIAANEENSNKIKLQDGWRELYARREIPLVYNFRSRQNVVAFNNDFFSFCSTHEHLPKGYRELYARAPQQARGEEGGYVEITLYKKDQDHQAEDTLAKIRDTIRDCRSRGFAYRDICLLVRNKVHIDALSFYLREEGIPFVGSDSLKLSQSPVVRGLMSALQMVVYPKDEQLRIPFLELLFSDAALPEEEHYGFMKKWGKAPLHQFLHQVKELHPDFNRKAFNNAGAYRRVSLLLSALHQVEYSDPFLQKFLDEVLRLQERYGPTVQAVADWWEQEGAAVSIALPENTDAVRLDTIHKSKGLEFPVVLLPFANWSLFSNRTEGWLELEPAENHGLPCAYIKLKRKTEDILHQGIAQLCEQETDLQLVDNLNMLYVALTRAVDELYIIAKEKKGHTLELFLKQYLEQQGAQHFYTHGKRTEHYQDKDNKEDTRHYLNVEKYRPNREHSALKISSHAPQHWQENVARTRGRMVHHVLSLLEPGVSPEKLLQDNVQRGALPPEEAAGLLPLLREVLQHRDLQAFFGGAAQQVLAERDILLPKGGTQRPDRVVVSENVAHVLDYKTGHYREEDAAQVDAYMNLLQQMGYQAGERALVYLSDTVEVKKW